MWLRVRSIGARARSGRKNKNIENIVNFRRHHSNVSTETIMIQLQVIHKDVCPKDNTIICQSHASSRKPWRTLRARHNHRRERILHLRLLLTRRARPTLAFLSEVSATTRRRHEGKGRRKFRRSISHIRRPLRSVGRRRRRCGAGAGGGCRWFRLALLLGRTCSRSCFADRAQGPNLGMRWTWSIVG